MPPSLRALAVIAVLLVAPHAHAKDLLDYVIDAVDPTLAPARPLIECLAGGGQPTVCAAEAAKKQATGALPIGPGDDRVKKTVAVIKAARDERWLDVVTIGGETVAKVVGCAVLPVQGPAKGTACSIFGWVMSKNVAVVDQAYQALKGPDWWALVDLLGTGVCKLIPSDGAAGAAKDVLCGPLAAVLLEAKQMAGQLAKGVVAGTDALENVVFGDDSHMPYDKYYALYWQPWYHYGVDRLLQGQSVGGLADSIWGPCVDYFDSHNQYRKTARKTCSRMKDQRFLPELKAFAAALPVAVDGYFDTVARPAIWGAVLHSYGKPKTGEPPGQKFFQQNCAFQMRARFPFPEPNELRCELLSAQAKKFTAFGSAFEKLASKCRADVKAQLPAPTAWQRSCDAMAPRYGQTFAGESLRFIGIIGKLKKVGCHTPSAQVAKAEGLRFTCDDYSGYSMCLDALGSTGKKYCRRQVPVVGTSGPPGEAKASPQPVVVPPPASGGRLRRPSRPR